MTEDNLPTRSGGLGACYPYYYKYGQYSLSPTFIYQDKEGRIKQYKHNTPASTGDILVDLDRNPSKNGFALTAWGLDAQGGIPFEIRVYWIDTSGGIYERCYSSNGGPGAVWYDGPLTGQFKAAPYSCIAANCENGEKTRVYFQENDTNNIRELYRAGRNTFDPFVLQEGTRGNNALRSTCIATDATGYGSTEVYYQAQDSTWVVDGGDATNALTANTEFQYNPGAAITVVGSTKSEEKPGYGRPIHAKVFTVAKGGRMIATEFDPATKEWQPSAQMVKVVPNELISASFHPPQTSWTGWLFDHQTSVLCSQIGGNRESITEVGFTSVNSWDVLPK
ncbi:hypothetical protein BDZ91DRAFT_832038 [Kalaharituber pfeilii]|nr:hypothetical protein BDZ91DRAFT_832038 [Kalaharituber pfeilii]